MSPSSCWKVWGQAANSIIKSRREKSWLFKFFAIFQVGRVTGGGGLIVLICVMYNVGPWHMSPLLHFGHFQWPRWIPLCWLGWVAGGEFLHDSHLCVVGGCQLPGRSAGTARGLGTSPVDGLPHCAVTLQGQEKWCSRTPEADPSCDTSPLLPFVWECEGYCLSAGLCPSLEVSAPFGARFQQQNPTQGLSPCHGRDSTTVFLFLFHIIAFPTTPSQG